MLQAALSPISQKAYRLSLRGFKQYLSQFHDTQCVVPASVPAVIGFVAYLFEQGMSPSTISSKLSALSYVHKLKGFPDPTNAFVVKKMVTGSYKLRSKPDSRLPVTPALLTKLVRSLRFSAKSQFVYRLLKAMFLLSFFAFLRIGELTVRSLVSPSPVLQYHDMTVHPKGYLLLSMSHFKHNSTKRTVTLSISPQSHALCPVKAMLSYFRVRGSGSGPLFAWPDGSPITRGYFNKQLHQTVKLSGLNHKFYKDHSFRIGAATWAAQVFLRTKSNKWVAGNPQRLKNILESQSSNGSILIIGVSPS